MAEPKKPQDRLAKREAQIKDAEFDYNGIHYSIPADRLDDIEIFELIEDGFNIRAVRQYLGVEQWQEFKDSVRTDDGRVPAEPTNEFLDIVMSHVGGGSSESPNSAASRTS
jgi:hypothetical protein